MPGANKMLLRFWKSQDGNYAAIFAIAMLPIMSGVAGVVDYVGTSTSASKLQSILDATGLAIASKYDSGIPSRRSTSSVPTSSRPIFAAPASFSTRPMRR